MDQRDMYEFFAWFERRQREVVLNLANALLSPAFGAHLKAHPPGPLGAPLLALVGYPEPWLQQMSTGCLLALCWGSLGAACQGAESTVGPIRTLTKIAERLLAVGYSRDPESARSEIETLSDLLNRRIATMNATI